MASPFLFYRTLPLIFITVFILLSGCSAQEWNSDLPPKPSRGAEKSGDPSTCTQLQNLFRESVSGFRDIRKQPSYRNKVTFWESSYQLISQRCEIWQWSNKYSYVCQRALPDRDNAESVYNEAASRINQCLSERPSPWHKQERLLDARGVETQYRFNGDVRGSLKLVDTGGLFLNSWTVYFQVDSP